MGPGGRAGRCCMSKLLGQEAAAGKCCELRGWPLYSLTVLRNDVHEAGRTAARELDAPFGESTMGSSDHRRLCGSWDISSVSLSSSGGVDAAALSSEAEPEAVVLEETNGSSSLLLHLDGPQFAGQEWVRLSW